MLLVLLLTLILLKLKKNQSNLYTRNTILIVEKSQYIINKNLFVFIDFIDSSSVCKFEFKKNKHTFKEKWNCFTSSYFCIKLSNEIT